MAQDPFFPTIGTLAEKADGVPDNIAVDTEAQENRPLEEIESLCMKCGEQARPAVFNDSYR